MKSGGDNCVRYHDFCSLFILTSDVNMILARLSLIWLKCVDCLLASKRQAMDVSSSYIINSKANVNLNDEQMLDGYVGAERHMLL